MGRRKMHIPPHALSAHAPAMSSRAVQHEARPTASLHSRLRLGAGGLAAEDLSCIDDSLDLDDLLAARS